MKYFLYGKSDKHCPDINWLDGVKIDKYFVLVWKKSKKSKKLEMCITFTNYTIICYYI